MIDKYTTEREALTNWRDEFQPLLWLSNGDEAFETIWEQLGEMVLPLEYVWVNYDDDGTCYLTCLAQAPSPDKVSYIGMLICPKPYTENEGTYLVTDIDEECIHCEEGFIEEREEECEKCDGTGVIWVELFDVSGINKNTDFLNTWKWD